MKTRFTPLLIAGALSLSLLSAIPAEAATNSVTIKKIAAKTAPYKKSVTVTPRVSASGKVKVSSKTLTVKKGSKTVAKNKSRVKLKAGKYKVTQTVKYRTYKNIPTNVLEVRAGRNIPYWYDVEDAVAFKDCTIISLVHEDYFRAQCRIVDATVTYVTVDSSQLGGVYEESFYPGQVIYPEWVRSPVNLYRRVNVPKYSGIKHKSLTQSLTVKQGKKPRGCATKAAFNRVKFGDSKSTVTTKMGSAGKLYYQGDTIEGREYKACSKYQYMSVSFADGSVYDKTFMDMG